MSITGAQPDLAKTSFDGIYDQPDPRRYFHELGAHDYAVPHYGQRVFREVLAALPVERPTVVDVCCSYGINAALLKHDVQLSDLYDHYRSEDLAELSTDELAERDGEFYAASLIDGAPEVVGLDTAAKAVGYAIDVGLLDHGAAEDLESRKPSSELAAAVAGVDLVTVTGGIGYVTDRTFGRLLDCATSERPPWVASLCLRTVPFDPIADRLAAYGLVTEQLEDLTYPQRRFTCDEEREYAMSELDARGVEPDGRESEGVYHVNVFLSRPAEDAAERPIDDVLRNLPKEPDHKPSA